MDISLTTDQAFLLVHLMENRIAELRKDSEEDLTELGELVSLKDELKRRATDQANLARSIEWNRQFKD